MWRPSLRHGIDRRVTINWIQDQGRIQALGVGGRKASVPASAPLHRSPYSVSVAQIDIVPHSDFVAVIDDGSARQGHQYAIHQLDASAVIFQQRSQPST